MKNGGARTWFRPFGGPLRRGGDSQRSASRASCTSEPIRRHLVESGAGEWCRCVEAVMAPRAYSKADQMGGVIAFPRIELPERLAHRSVLWCEMPGLIHTSEAFRSEGAAFVAITLCGREAPALALQFQP